VGYFFGKAFQDPNPPTPTATPTVTSTPTTVPATPTPTATATPEPLKEVTVLQSESLWEIAGKPEIYNDPELYPLLVDANRNALKPINMSVKAGKKLVVPRGITSEMIRKARQNAWKAKYRKFRGRGLTKKAYQKWREQHMPTINQQ